MPYNVYESTHVRNQQPGSPDFIHFSRNGQFIRNFDKENCNLHDGLQVKVFREIARFLAITLPVLEMTGNEIVRVF